MASASSASSQSPLTASIEGISPLNCCKCHKRLNKMAKSFVCLHNLCEACPPQNECSECGELFSGGVEVGHLPSYLLKMLRKEKIERPEWHCDVCRESSLTSGATFWCEECEVFLCDNCNRYHKRFSQGNHFLVELEERRKSVDIIMAKNCLIHEKSREFYCNECNICYCDKCYKEYHSSESPSCMRVSGPLSVRTEIKRKRNTELPTLLKEVGELEETLRGSKKTISKSLDRLNSECLRECEKVWIEFEKLMENERKNAEKLCEKIQEKNKETEKKWLECLKEYERMAKQVETWRTHVEYLLQELEENSGVVLGEGEVLCGLTDLMCKWSGGQKEGEKKWSLPPLAEKFVEYKVSLPNWWLEAIYPSRNVENESREWCIVKTTKQQSEKFIQQKEVIVPPPGLNSDSQRRWMSSILISPKDSHFFVSDLNNGSVLEFNELGNLRHEFSLRDTLNVKFRPLDMCWISPDNFVVCGEWGKSNILFLERVENPPFLQITKQVSTNKRFYSLCKKDEIIFCCAGYFQIHCFSENGERIKTIKFEGPKGRWDPYLRFDESGGHFWGARLDSSEVSCFDSNGKKITSFKKEEDFSDFCFLDKKLFFVTKKGIFSFLPEKCLQEFEKQAEEFPVFSIFENRIFVCLEIEGKGIIKIFEII